MSDLTSRMQSANSTMSDKISGLLAALALPILTWQMLSPDLSRPTTSGPHALDPKLPTWMFLMDLRHLVGFYVSR